MGKLRIEPKVKPPVTKEEYEYYKGVLNEALSAADSNYVFYDLEKNDDARKVRKALKYVAQEEGADLIIRADREKNSLALKFQQSRRSRTAEGSAASSGRISAEESRSRIVSALASTKESLKKSAIISATGVSPSSWNLRIKELLDEGTVRRHGSGRETTYSLKRK
jgi:predicted transcriptional regulator